MLERKRKEIRDDESYVLPGNPVNSTSASSAECSSLFGGRFTVETLILSFLQAWKRPHF